MPLPPVLALMGPTASGKSMLALQLAEQLDGEIISVDSSLVYRGMDIGTAKPSPAEMARIPHHLIDILHPAESYSTGRFCREARTAISDIHGRKRLPILVGGTMLYFQALLHGLAELPPAHPDIRQRLEQERSDSGLACMHEKLALIDPLAAARIHPNDPQRILRALEVYQATGQTLSDWQAQQSAPSHSFDVWSCVLAPESRQALDPRIRQRFHAMLASGFENEVRRLHDNPDLHTGLPAMRAVGYRQLWDYLDGRDSYESMVEKAIIATRQFAKRQYTWLRREKDRPHFLSDSPALAERVTETFLAWRMASQAGGSLG
ncbi:MAG: tRNA delta(2)-isopentenylpyrophosphate transferase [Pseudomonadota bacterium]